ncbi:MAG: beta subunit of hydroxylase component of benzoate 1,2-dioxygenase [Solirubrobacterales bacterium]|nr:beta subunit of hydroxylase component of benzoate 1,2-dioxygenase [Solirubrobacterales bacterium]
MTALIAGRAQLPPNVTRADIEDFLYLEARLQDEHRYEEWDELWAEDGTYWVPAGGDDIDPDQHVSFIHDNRMRITTRVRQLTTGEHHAQMPASRLRRVLGNVEVLAVHGAEIEVGANFVLAESRNGSTTLWSGRTIYRLRDGESGLRMSLKKVLLNNNDGPIPTMAFLI